MLYFQSLFSLTERFSSNYLSSLRTQLNNSATERLLTAHTLSLPGDCAFAFSRLSIQIQFVYLDLVKEEEEEDEQEAQEEDCPCEDEDAQDESIS